MQQGVSPVCLGLLLALLVGCSHGVKSSSYPVSAYEEDVAQFGRLTGSEGIVLFGGSSSKSVGITVNAYLWRASLDVLSFLPLASVDPFAGVIMSDWYISPEYPYERFKVNTLILSDILRSDGVKVTVFKQKKSGTEWFDETISASIATDIEDKIISKARDLRAEDI
jgi:hypothetical protein